MKLKTFEEFKLNEQDDYTPDIAYDKMEKFMSTEPEDMDEFYEIIDSNDSFNQKVKDMTDFLERIIQDEGLYTEYSNNYPIESFAKYLIKNH